MFRIGLPLILFAVAAAAAACQHDTTLAPVCGAGYPTIDIDPQTPSMFVHDTLTLTAKFNACANLTRPGVWRWRTSNSGVVSVDTVRGRMTGVAAGQATITVTDSADRAQSGFVYVSVSTLPTGGP